MSDVTSGTPTLPPAAIGTYVDHKLDDLIMRALYHAAAQPENLAGAVFTDEECVEMEAFAHTLSNDTWLLQTTAEPPKKVLWRAGWLIPGAKPATGYQVLDSWSDGVEYMLDVMSSVAEGKGAGSDVEAKGVRRRTTYTTIKENEEGWVRFFNRVWFIEKLDDPNN